MTAWTRNSCLSGLIVAFFASLLFGSAPAYAYDSSTHVYDGAPHNVAVHTSEVSPVASLDESEGVQEGVATATGVSSVLSRLSVAANSATNALKIEGPNGALNLTEHAVERMTQRGITTSQVEATVTGQQGFSYTLDGVARTGYYDPVTQIFVGTVESRVTTVIGSVKPQYIENLKAG